MQDELRHLLQLFLRMLHNAVEMFSSTFHRHGDVE